MTTKMKIVLIALAVAAVLGATVASTPPKVRFTIHVVDEDGKPVKGATASIIFHPTPIDSDPYTTADVVSDENGNFTAEGASAYGDFAMRKPLIKEGYYSSGLNAPSFNHAVKDGHWQPWDQTFTTVLRKIGNPTPMYVRKFGSVVPGALNEPCGFDLEEGDWVAPYGKGKVTDFIVTCTYLKYTDYNNNEATTTLTFPSRLPATRSRRR